MRDQDHVGEGQDVPVAGFCGDSGCTFLGGGKRADDLRGAGGDGGLYREAERLRRAPALLGPGQDDDGGCSGAQQNAQHVALNGGVKAADHRRTLRPTRIGPVLRLQDDVARAGFGAEESDGPDI